MLPKIEIVINFFPMDPMENFLKTISPIIYPISKIFSLTL